MSILDARQSKPLEGGPSFSLTHRLERAAWWFAWLLLARWTPPPFHRWRVLLLNSFGADVHSSARIYGSTRIWYPRNLSVRRHATIGPHANVYCMDKVQIDEFAVVSQGAHLCCGTHDITSPSFQLVAHPIHICAHSWVAAEAFIGPNVTVNTGAVIGARAVLFKNAEPLGVYVGNPAVFVKFRESSNS